MDIEVGDFVRTINGIIGKVEQVGNSLFWLEDGSSYNLDDTKIKYSKNIIDLIVVGDFVNGYRVLEICKLQNDKYIFTTCKSDFKNICRVWGEEDIETILTYEQYLKNCYTVERN